MQSVHCISGARTLKRRGVTGARLLNRRGIAVQTWLTDTATIQRRSYISVIGMLANSRIHHHSLIFALRLKRARNRDVSKIS